MTAPATPLATRPALRGGVLAVLAAVLFGVSTPLVQRLGAGLGAFTTAALLYAGAALVGALLRQPVTREARLIRPDLPRLLAMAAFGAVLGPVALAWGLQHTSGTSASLMLTLEAVFTAVLAWRLYGESMGSRVWAALALLLAGGLLLVLDQGQAGRTQLLGLLAVAAGHGGLGRGQHAVARAGGARPGPGGGGKGGAGGDGHGRPGLGRCGDPRRRCSRRWACWRWVRRATG